jgi:preprotein translocase subunit Sec63
MKSLLILSFLISTGTQSISYKKIFNGKDLLGAAQSLNQQDIIGLYVTLSADFKICSLELLNMWVINAVIVWRRGSEEFSL